MKSIFPSEMINKAVIELSLDSIAAKLIYFQEQLQLIHWQTMNYAEHQATGNIYEYIQKFKDDVIEKLIGYTNKRPGVFKLESLSNCSSNECVSELLKFASELKMYGEKNNFHDICNLADELSGQAAKTLYLLTLT